MQGTTVFPKSYSICHWISLIKQIYKALDLSYKLQVTVKQKF